MKANVAAAAATGTASATTGFNGLGDMPIYTYVGKKLTDELGMKVNAANGNLVLEQKEMYIPGRQNNLTLTDYYNSEDNDLLDTGICGTLALAWRHD